MRRMYYDVNRRDGKIRGTLMLTDEQALGLLVGGNFLLRPAGWKLDDLKETVS